MRFELRDFIICMFALDILPRESSQRDIPAIRLPTPGCLSVVWHMHFHGVMVRRHSRGKSQRIIQSKLHSSHKQMATNQNQNETETEDAPHRRLRGGLCLDPSNRFVRLVLVSVDAAVARAVHVGRVLAAVVGAVALEDVGV